MTTISMAYERINLSPEYQSVDVRVYATAQEVVYARETNSYLNYMHLNEHRTEESAARTARMCRRHGANFIHSRLEKADGRVVWITEDLDRSTRGVFNLEMLEELCEYLRVR